MYSRNFASETENETIQTPAEITMDYAIPKDYSGNLYRTIKEPHEEPIPEPLPPIAPLAKEEEFHTTATSVKENPKGGLLSSLFDNFRISNISMEDLLLIGVLFLLVSNQADDDILLILAILLFLG